MDQHSDKKSLVELSNDDPARGGDDARSTEFFVSIKSPLAGGNGDKKTQDASVAKELEDTPTASSTPTNNLLPNPFDTANVVSRTVLWWLNPLIALGAKKPLEEEDIYSVPTSHKVSFATEAFVPYWEKMAQRGYPALSLYRALIWSLWSWLVPSAILYCCYIAAQLATPYIVNAIVLNIDNAGGEFWGISDGNSLIGLLVAFTLVSVITINIAFTTLTRVGFNARNACMDAVYRKALRLSSSAKQSNTIGETVTLMSVDSERIFMSFLLLHWLWAGIVLFGIALGLLVNFVGVAALAGVGVMVVVLVSQFYLANLIGKLRRSAVTATQERVKLISETLQGIRVMKYSAWEEPIGARVEKARQREIQYLKHLAYIKTVNMVILFIAPVFVAGAIFLVYVATGEELDVGIVFTTMAYINILRLPLAVFPNAVASFMEGLVSARRLERFFRLGELTPLLADGETFGEKSRKGPASSLLLVEEEEQKVKQQLHGPVGSIAVTDAAFAWSLEHTNSSSNGSTSTAAGSAGVASASPSSPASSADASGSGGLSNINLSIAPGALCAVVGTVGAGKTSLLQALLGQMHQVSGSAAVNGKVAYVSQEAWIQHATLRDNVLFYSPYIPKRYSQVLRVAQLAHDLSILPNGDMTEIGERGINLSGGQKARVALARALYRPGTDIYLLDDPLSAVDAHVAKQIFSHAVVSLLKDKTRVLVLNSHYHFLNQCDQVVIMEKGELVAVGHPTELAPKFPSFFNVSAEEEEEEELAAVEEEDERQLEAELDKPLLDVVPPSPTGSVGSRLSFRSRSMLASRLESRGALGSKGGRDRERGLSSRMEGIPGSGKGKLHTAEDKESGAVTTQTYIDYFASAGRSGVFMFTIILIGFMLSQVGRTLSDWWLAVWSEKDFGLSQMAYVWIFIGLALVTSVITLARSFLFINASLSISYNIHHDIFQRILRAPITLFYDVTPLGRIINKFSKDLDQVDSFLPDFFMQLLQNGLVVLGVIIFCCFTSPWIILIFLPIVLAYAAVDLYFRRSSREIKRLESVSRTPIFSSFSETLAGLSTIRAYSMQPVFLTKNRNSVNDNTRHFFIYWMASRWLALRLDALSAVVVLIVGLFAINMRSGSAGVASLALIYSMQLTGLLQWTVRNSIMVENSMTSTERILHYRTLPSEADAIIPGNRPDPSWPQHGALEFRSVVMRYRPELEVVLKGISFTIKPREKIGICGRTGAGKSSIMLALFRIVEIESGSVIIDGIDISSIGLRDLRSKLAIIPQDPVMFSGSVRDNLDPFHEYDDEAIWQALRRVHLANDVTSMPQKLETLIVEGGENLSVGQRQLICIGRALLKPTTILVMDEATASVDTSTDALIQQTIRENFQDRTVLCIAHRLETIMDSDRIAVISDGVVAELDAPEALLNNPESHLTKLVAELGDEVRDAMKQMTKK